MLPFPTVFPFFQTVETLRGGGAKNQMEIFVR